MHYYLSSEDPRLLSFRHVSSGGAAGSDPPGLAVVFPAVGLGEDYRLRGGGLIGAALPAEGRVAHVMGFPA